MTHRNIAVSWVTMSALSHTLRICSGGGYLVMVVNLLAGTDAATLVPTGHGRDSPPRHPLRTHHLLRTGPVQPLEPLEPPVEEVVLATSSSPC